MTQLVRFGTAGQVYRVGEAIFPRGPKHPPPPSPPPPAPEAPPLVAWATHALAEAWLDQFTQLTGLGAPLDWAPGATLAQKHAAALQLWERWRS